MTHTSEQTAIVTGAASGIGQATVELFREDSSYDRIAAFDLNPEIEEMFEPPVVSHVVDVADSTAVKDAVAALESNGDVVAVANCAGISQPGWIDEISSSDWDRIINVNLKGPFNLAKATGPAMYGRGDGAFVTVSSGAGQRGSVSGGVHYSAAKAGLFGLTRGLAKQLAPSVRVNCVVPGLIDTPLTTDSDLWEADEIESFASTLPLGRIGDPAEIANAIAFLCSEQSSYMTGSILTVDGGAQLS